MMFKRMQKILAVALTTSFLTTSMIAGIAEAAPPRHSGGRGTAQTQQVRPERRGNWGQTRGSGRQERPSFGRTGSGRQDRPSFGRAGSRDGRRGWHRSDRGRYRYPEDYRGRRPRPVVYDDPYGDYGDYRYRRYPDYYRRHRHRHRTNDDRVIGALIIGGVIGAVIANSNKPRTPNPTPPPPPPPPPAPNPT